MPTPSAAEARTPPARRGLGGLVRATAAVPLTAARTAAAGTALGVRTATRLADGVGGVVGSALGPALGSALASARDLGPQRHGRHVWAGRTSGLVEVRGLAGADHDAAGPDRRALGDAVQSALRAVRGVRWAQVNAVTGHVLVLFDERPANLADVVEAVAAVEEAHGTAAGGWSRDSPPHPADSAPLTAAGLALLADCAGLGAAVLGRLTRIGPLPSAARVTVGLVEAQPRLRRLAEHALGPAGADLAVGVGSGIVHGLSEGIGPLVVTAAGHAQLLAEVRSRRAVWQERAEELCAAPGSVPDHPPVTADRPFPFPGGPVESFADLVAAASLAAATGVFAVTRDANRAAALLLVGVPPAARLGREAFAATLARQLAGRGVVPMDPGAFRRLDRIGAVVIDAAALGDGAQRLAALVDAPDSPVTLLPPGGESAFDAVRRLQRAGHGVLVVTAGNDDALAAADVAVSLRRDGGAVGWAADLLGGEDPAPAATLLAAVPAARRLSRRVVWIAGLGSAAAALLTGLSPFPYSDLTMQPVYLSGLLAQVEGFRAARRLARPDRSAPVRSGPVQSPPVGAR